MSNTENMHKNPGYDHLIEKIQPYMQFDKINCVFEIGSRDAYDSIFFENTFPNSKIHAFEPNPNQYEICVKNVLKADAQHVTVEKLALSDKEGELDFYVTPGNIGASSLLRPQFVPWTGDQTVNKITVQCTTLDQFCNQKNIKPEVIWMDVQGNELNVLKGAKDSLHNVQVIYTEAGVIPYYDGHTMKNDIIEYLENFGFVVLDDKLDWSHESNVIFIKKSLLVNNG